MQTLKLSKIDYIYQVRRLLVEVSALINYVNLITPQYLILIEILTISAH